MALCVALAATVVAAGCGGGTSEPAVSPSALEPYWATDTATIDVMRDGKLVIDEALYACDTCMWETG